MKREEPDCCEGLAESSHALAGVKDGGQSHLSRLRLGASFSPAVSPDWFFLAPLPEVGKVWQLFHSRK